MSFNLTPNIFNVNKRWKKLKVRSRMGNLEKLATLGTRHKTKSNKTKNTTQKAKTNEQHGPYQKLGLNPCARKT